MGVTESICLSKNATDEIKISLNNVLKKVYNIEKKCLLVKIRESPPFSKDYTVFVKELDKTYELVKHPEYPIKSKLFQCKTLEELTFQFSNNAEKNIYLEVSVIDNTYETRALNLNKTYNGASSIEIDVSKKNNLIASIFSTSGIVNIFNGYDHVKTLNVDFNDANYHSIDIRGCNILTFYGEDNLRIQKINFTIC